MSLAADAKKGRLAGLLALRDVLAASIEDEDTRPSDRASLAGRLITCLAQVEELEKAQPKGSRVDDLANRRKARRADAAGVVAASGGGVKRGG